MLLIGLISILLAIALYSLKITPILLIRLTSILLLYSAALSYNTLYVQSIGSGVGIYSNLCNITVISQYFDIILFIIASLILLPWGNFDLFKQYKNYSSVLPTILEYPLIILFSLLGSTFLISSADLISMYLSIELQSFGVYILACLYRDSESSTYAGLKYFLLGGLSSAFILLGSAFIYSSTGVTNFINIYSIACINNNIDLNIFWGIDKGIILGMIIITFGLLFKIAGAPFHNWAPDVYDGVPTIITTWLIIMPKLAIFIFFIEFINGYAFISSNIYNIWFNLILISALLSLLIGTIVGLSQYRIKRLLSYSTISHVGFMLLALGIYNEQSIESFLFYIIQYSLTSLNIFCILLAFGYSIIYNDIFNINKDIKFISQLKGQFMFNPLLALSFAICLFSMAGIPPLIGFFAKQMVLYSSIQHGYYFLSIIAIIVSVISAAYYLKIIKVIHFDYNNDIDKDIISYHNINYLSTSHSFIIAIMTLFILLFVLKPNLILNSIHIMTLSLFYY